MPNYGNRCCDRQGSSTTFAESIVEQVLGKRTVRMQYPMARLGLWNKMFAAYGLYPKSQSFCLS